MEKTKKYYWTKFKPTTIKSASKELRRILSPDQSKELENSFLNIRRGVETWKYDNEAEFFADYRSDFDHAFYDYIIIKLPFPGLKLEVDLTHAVEPYSQVSVSLRERSNIEAVFSVFEDAVSRSKIPKPPLPPEVPWKSQVKIFIGHGKSPQWRDLKDHLHEKHKIKIEAYEVGSRAGHAIRDVLGKMLSESMFAILVMTGEDETKGGKVLARQNVIHEAGLFQGRLGFDKAIILLEEGTEEFSNIKGIEQIRYSKNNIKETYGEILATLEREFGPKGA